MGAGVRGGQSPRSHGGWGMWLAIPQEPRGLEYVAGNPSGATGAGVCGGQSLSATVQRQVLTNFRQALSQNHCTQK